MDLLRSEKGFIPIPVIIVLAIIALIGYKTIVGLYNLAVLIGFMLIFYFIGSYVINKFKK